jgi:hypothetical protein
MSGKRQHFVPRHYLRKFCLPGTEQIAGARIEPFTLFGPVGIKDQCKADNFYENQVADDLMTQTEKDLAPVLTDVLRKESFNSKDLVALRFLVATLHIRTRKAVEAAKVYPKRIAYEVIKNGIERGRLPAPKEGWKEGMMDFGGVPGSLIKYDIIPVWMEMQTLECKLLKAEGGAFFLTSDHPVVVLNERFAKEEPERSYVGFSRSGFQCLLPLSPKLCLCSYDARVYKVGGRKIRVVPLSVSDVEIVNSLQVQNADKCLYFHDASMGRVIEGLVKGYSNLRLAIGDSLRVRVSPDGREKMFHMRNPSVTLPKPWNFCRLRRHANIGPDLRRNPAWTEMCKQAVERMNRDPESRNIFDHIGELLGISFEEPNDGS